MKKITTLFLLVLVLMSTVGCSKKTYSKEDVEVLALIERLDELKEESNEDIVIDYKVERTMKDKYLCEITFEFGEHKFELKTIQDSPKIIEESLDTYDGTALWTCKVDGVEYDYDTAEVLVNHYYDAMMYAD